MLYCKPAFLVRQTDLVVCCQYGKGKLEKGQFMSPESMKHAVQKVLIAKRKIMVTDRGTCFDTKI
jgi:2-dehydro-3-deoxyphosphooctonate aldolase (KDO 8-P synthase)